MYANLGWRKHGSIRGAANFGGEREQTVAAEITPPRGGMKGHLPSLVRSGMTRISCWTGTRVHMEKDSPSATEDPAALPLMPHTSSRPTNDTHASGCRHTMPCFTVNVIL